ncbi:MAG: tRNA (adenosine(37)-N6)-threonylcarbamoyltransferase complex dimerization subunit type 1 TsaB [Chitinophagaceae bacterium]
MSLILSIDTSTENASICLAENETCLFMASNEIQKDHAAWLHPAIMDALDNIGKKITDIKAVGLTAGPGSYTGVRVGMATAKGLCFALNIPLITVNTLEAMASIATAEDIDYICPMIDAKRMEVFTALYDKNLEVILPPCAMILDKNSFFEPLQRKIIIFFGNGKNKFQQIINKKTAIFKNLIFNASHLSVLIYRKYIKSEFSSLVESDPAYVKEYYTLYIKKS